MPIRLIGPGIFEMGQVRLDKKDRTISFPAVLNLDHGPMEYFLVTPYGKKHESILRTGAQPFHIHVAMLLLGAGSTQTNHGAEASQPIANGPIKDPSNEAVPGDNISIEIVWKNGDDEIHRPAGELIYRY